MLPSLWSVSLGIAAAAPAGPAMSVGDWVETNGAFSFVRVWNHGSAPVEVGDATVGDCRNVTSGCGGTGKRIVVDPTAVATIAVVTSGSAHERASFTYRYTARMAQYAYRGRGSASKTRPSYGPAMTRQQIAAAEASAIAALRGVGGSSAALSQAPSQAGPSPKTPGSRVKAPSAMDRPATPSVVTTREPPTPRPVEEASAAPPPLVTVAPTPVATREPTPVPTREPTPVPTLEPTPVPTVAPTPVPTRTAGSTRVAGVRPTPTPTATPGKSPHSFQHWLPRGVQHWLLHEP